MSILPHVNSSSFPISVANGGTGTSTAAGARTNLGLDPMTGMDVVGGRMDLGANATTLIWNFLTSNQIRLYNPTTAAWEIVNVTTAPTATPSTALNILGATQALAVDKIYDVFAAYNSSTAFDLEFSLWNSAGAGTSARTAAYAGGTTYAVGERVVDSSVYYVCIQAGSGHTPASSPTYWTSCGAAPANTDFLGLYQHNGIWVSGNSDSQKSKRWLGVIYAYNNSSTVNFKDDVNYRYVSNFYNKILKTCEMSAKQAYYTLTDTSYVEATDSVRSKSVICLSQGAMVAIGTTLDNNYAGASTCIGFTLNATQVNSGAYYASSPALTDNITIISQTIFPVGFNYNMLQNRVNSYQGGIYGTTFKGMFQLAQ